MKLVTYSDDGTDRSGVVIGEHVFDLLEAQKAVNALPGISKPNINLGRPLPGSVLALLQGEPKAVDEARRMHDLLQALVDQPGDLRLFRRAMRPLASVRWRPPIVEGPAVNWIGANTSHTIRERNIPIADWPVGFFKPNTTLRGHNEPLTIPAYFPSFRWTPELGVVIGRDAKDVNESDAMSYVFGYTCCNDMTSNYFSAFITEQVEKPSWLDLGFASDGGKVTDGMAPIGPWIVTKDEVPDPYDLMVYGRESGVLRDRGHTASLHVGIERTICFYSRFMTLQAGTIISMGALRMHDLVVTDIVEPEGYVEVEIERIGVLRTPIIDERVPMAARR